MTYTGTFYTTHNADDVHTLRVTHDRDDIQRYSSRHTQERSRRADLQGLFTSGIREMTTYRYSSRHTQDRWRTGTLHVAHKRDDDIQVLFTSHIRQMTTYIPAGTLHAGQQLRIQRAGPVVQHPSLQHRIDTTSLYQHSTETKHRIKFSCTVVL